MWIVAFSQTGLCVIALDDDKAGRPEGIPLVIGRWPVVAFSNSDGDRPMLGYAKAGEAARMSMIVLHDDAVCEYAHGPARGLPANKVCTFTQAFFDEAEKQGWILISMKDDWKRVFAFEWCGTTQVLPRFGIETIHWSHEMRMKDLIVRLVAGSAIALGAAAPVLAQAPATKPNIVVIMGDDIGMWNIGAYHRGMMAGRTPNLDKLAKEGMLFTDYYAEASCTAGRANFITGELPIRTGMTTVGQAGASVGLPAEAVTIATVLK